MTTEALPVGICDDCGRRVASGPLAGQDEQIEVEVPPWLTELQAVAYAIKVASQIKRCRTCLQVNQ